MAQHPVISQTLRHVSIGLEQYQLESRNLSLSPTQAIAFLTASAEQTSLMTTGRAVQLLAATFSLLPNLETVQLRDTDSITRHRDGPDAPWRSYGYCRALEALSEERSQLLFIVSSDPEFRSRVFTLVMAALAQSTARPPNLEVLLGPNSAGLKQSAFDLSPMPRLCAHGDGADVDAFTVLSGIRRLHLKLQFGFHPQWAHVVGRSEDPIMQSLQKNSVDCLPMHAWLAHCPNIEWLRLDLQGARSGHNNDFLCTMGLPLPALCPLPRSSTAMRDIAMPFASHLRHFDLRLASCYPDVLLGLLKRLPALEHLSLCHVSLLRLDTIRGTPQMLRKKLLRALAKSPMQLKYVSLKGLGVVNTSHPRPVVCKFYDVMSDGWHDIEYMAEFNQSLELWLQLTDFSARERG